MIIETSTLSQWQEAAPDPSARRLSYAERLEKARSAYGDTARFKFLTADGQAATPLEHAVEVVPTFLGARQKASPYYLEHHVTP